MNEIIRLENVVKMTHSNRRAVNDVSLCIQGRERVAVSGPPDSGKTTLMRLIAGIEAPSAGQIVVLDQAVHEMDANQAATFRNRNIGIVRRHAGFMERVNVLENVSLPLAVQGISLSKRNKEAKELLKSLGIPHIAHAHPFQLSAYEELTASIARALITKPKILLMYEATANLSEREMEQFTGLMNVMLQYGTYTILSFSASPNNILREHRTVLLHHGKIQEDRS